MKYILAFSFIVFTAMQSNAQDESAKKLSGKSKGYSLLNAGLESSTVSYINTDTKDSSGSQPYLSPYIDYNHKTGLGIKVKSYAIIGGSDPGFYMSYISPYYARYEGKVFPYISYTRYFQHDNPSVPVTPIQNEIYAHVRFKTKIVDPWVGIDLGFGKDELNNNESVNDINAFIALSRLFLKDNMGSGNNNALGIRPTIGLNAGTDRYFKFLRTSGYISQNKGAGNGYGNGYGSGGSGNSSASQGVGTISAENEFALSNIEANLYVMFFLGNFSIEPSGSLYFPVRGDDKSPYGYLQINLNYWF